MIYLIGTMSNHVSSTQLKDYLREAVLQNVIKEIIRCDLDRDGMLNRKEAAVLATSLQVGLGAYGIVFDVNKFHRAIGLSPSLFSAVAIVKRLIPDRDNRLSSFYSAMSDTIAETTTSELEHEEDTLFDMFYIPIRRAFEGSLADTIYTVKNKLQGPKYMSLSPAPRHSFMSLPSNGMLEEAVSCPECPECPYCIAKPHRSMSNTESLDDGKVRCARFCQDSSCNC